MACSCGMCFAINNNQMKKKIAPGQVVQIGPWVPSHGGCFMLVTKVSRATVDGFMVMPSDTPRINKFEISCSLTNVRYVGPAPFVEKPRPEPKPKKAK